MKNFVLWFARMKFVSIQSLTTAESMFKGKTLYFYEGRVSKGTVADAVFGHLRVWGECFLQASTCSFGG